MIICGLKLTHDGGVAVVADGRLRFSAEMEKFGNNPRYSGIEDGATIGRILEEEGIAVEAVDAFVVDGWGGFNAEALAIQPRLEVGEAQNWLSMSSGTDAYRLPVAQYCERRVGDDILSPLYFEGLRLGGREVPYSSYFHVAGHVLGAYCASPFSAAGESAYVLVWDGGMYPHLYYIAGDGRRVESLGPLFLLIGNVYTIFSQHFGPFKVAGRFAKDDLSIAGKVMAYIALGRVRREWFEDFSSIYEQQYDKPMGFANMLAQTFKSRRGAAIDRDEDVLCTFHCYLEELLVAKLAKKIARTGHPSRNLCLAGGCALNIKWNRAIRAAGLFDRVFIPPFPNDSGSAIGMACAHMFSATDERALAWDVFAGPRVGRCQPLSGWTVRECSPSDCARLLHGVGEPVVFMNGRAELGPRALGHRSILAPAVNRRMKDVLNRIKGREAYRPVAPICLEDRAREVFSPGSPDPYMLFDHDVTDAWRERVPAVCHLDGTARLQTVSRADDPDMHELLTAYADLSGIPLLCNTSANHRGRGFFPDTTSAMAWGALNYVWCDGRLYERESKCTFPELQ